MSALENENETRIDVIDQKSQGQFGTFGGVFTPCVLTILGVILFLRFGQVVGEAGLWHALAIILVAKLITILTAFSLSAIATNTQLKGGGAYFLISRSLGPEFGGVIGIVLFIAQAVSVSMYVIGFTEAFVAAFPDSGFAFRDIATAVNIATFVCVFIGAGWTIKLQYGILVVLVLSLLAFFVGAVPNFSIANFETNVAPSYVDGSSALVMFALFFPAVTGIMAGANMSGDLEDPGRSIPSGTITAIGVTAVIYIFMAFALAFAAPSTALIGDSLIVKSLSISPALITAGIFAATLSSALSSMMGAPRILQAFGRDRIFKSSEFFAVGSGESQEPRRATVLTFVIAQAGIMLGDLNAIAPIISMFFMVTYGTLNLACFYEGYSKNPSYRPKFRFSHWSLALAGAIGCAIVMILINPVWAIMSVAIIALLFYFISRAEVKARWGDTASGVAFEKARKSLLKLEQQFYHPKNWRPVILALSGGSWRNLRLAEYAHWLAAGRGIVTLAQLLPDMGENKVSRRRDAERRLRKLIHEEALSAFPVVVTERRLAEGTKLLLEAHGIGGMRPNTVMLRLPEEPDRREEFFACMRVADSYERNVVIVDSKGDVERWQVPDGCIDVLWQGAEHGELMVMLGHLLTKNPEWRDTPLRLLAALPEKGDASSMQAEVRGLLETARIEARLLVLSGDDLYTMLAKRTGTSAVLITEFTPPIPGEEAAFVEWTENLARLTPDIIYVHSAQHVALNA